MDKFKELAERIMFGGGLKATDLTGAGVELKAGKTFDDLRACVQRAVKSGAGKVEREVDAIASALPRVLSVKKTEKAPEKTAAEKAGA